MEIELKFLIDEEFTRDKIFNDKHLQEISEGSEIETIPMKAIYFDTEEKDLLKKEMAYRVRYEDGRIIATLKWGGSAEDGLHMRGELNVPVDRDFVKNPDITVFQESAIYEEILQAAGEKKLIPVMEMEFVRKQVQIDTGKSISVVSYDEGEIRTAGGSAPISELEIELYSGDQQDMIRLGTELATRYNLKAGNKSKFQRGLELLGYI